MTEKRAGLSAMTLKYIAMATMLVDHMGYVLFPWILWLRCVGRIAFPIFAFQIAAASAPMTGGGTPCGCCCLRC